MTPAKVIEDTPTGAAAEDLQYVKVSRKPAPPPPSNGLYSADGRHENDWYNQSFGDYHVSEHPLAAKRKIRIIAVGAGASGLQLAYKFERQLEDAELQIYERNADVGGTWLENRYPGCECDIPSHSYQFRWARNPSWSKFYSGSSEIWQYFKDVATRYDLEKYVKFQHSVQVARWNGEKGKWQLTIERSDGSTFEDECDMLANTSGILSTRKYPDLPGIQLFQGKLLHSAAWDKSYDIEGKKVAVIGGGSSAVQIIAALQPKVKKLVPFLRSAAWITTGFAAKFAGPGGTNYEYSEDEKERFRNHPEEFDKYCRDVEGELNKRFTLMHLNSEDQVQSRLFVADLMRKRLNHDPNLCEKLIPRFALGCRRMTPGTRYLESLLEDNVTVVTTEAAAFTVDGVVDANGIEHKVDAVVCATGFKNLWTPSFTVIGKDGRNLRDEWNGIPKGYLSIMAEGFPNLYLWLGPNGPASHSSVLPIFEWHTRYMFKMVRKMQAEKIKSFEPKPAAVEDFYQHTHSLLKRTAWSSACRSWFKNGKVHGPVVAIWPGSRLHYFEAMREVRYEDFDIEYLTGNRFQFFGNGYTFTELSDEGNSVWYFDDEEL